MNKKGLYKYQLICWILFAIICLCSCHSDDIESSSSIEGEWFYDNSTVDLTQFGTMKFSRDGAFEELYVQVGKATNEIITKKGSYVYRNRIEVVSTTKYDARQHLELYRVRNSDYNTLELYNESTSSTRKMHRIVGVYTMSVGETQTFPYSGNSSQMATFVSCNDKLVTVDDNGIIKAIKNGSTYVRRLSDTGETVVRVDIRDANNLIDNFEKYIYHPVSQVIADWGDNYLKTDSMVGTPNDITYNVYDTYIRELRFEYYAQRHVCAVHGDLQPDADYDALISSFDKRYSLFAGNDEYRVYKVFQEDHYIEITLFRKYRSFKYEIQPNDYERFEDLILCDITNAPWFAKFDYSGCKGVLNQPIDNSSIYQNARVEYDISTGRINEVRLECKPTITVATMCKWFDQHFFLDPDRYYITYYPYSSTRKSEFKVYVTENSSGNVSVCYNDNDDSL